jgi:membrane associated rhomboid family serine protease
MYDFINFLIWLFGVLHVVGCVGGLLFLFLLCRSAYRSEHKKKGES